MELNRTKQPKIGHRVFKRKKLKSSDRLRRAAATGRCKGVTNSSSYSIRTLGLHLKAFFLYLFARPLPDGQRPRQRNAALDPLSASRLWRSESGGTPIRLLFSIVVALIVLPLFFNFNTALAGKKNADAATTRLEQAADITVARLKERDDNAQRRLRHIRQFRHSLKDLRTTYKRRVPRPALKSIPPDFTRGSTMLKEVSFTFDGGSHRGQTKQILAILRRRSIKTTLFLTGYFIKENPELVRTMLKDGHEIGNHMLTHSHMTSYVKNNRHRTLPGVDKSFVVRELTRTADIFTRVTGQKMAPLWRAPYGELNKEIRGWAYNAGFVHVGWTTDHSARESLDSLDWVADPNSRLFLTTYQIKARILGFGKGRRDLRGAVALMHLGTRRRGEKLADRLGEMIDELHERGYRFVKASTLIKGRKDMAAYLLGTDHVAMLER